MEAAFDAWIEENLQFMTDIDSTTPSIQIPEIPSVFLKENSIFRLHKDLSYHCIKKYGFNILNSPEDSCSRCYSITTMEKIAIDWIENTPAIEYKMYNFPDILIHGFYDFAGNLLYTEIDKDVEEILRIFGKKLNKNLHPLIEPKLENGEWVVKLCDPSSILANI